MHFLGVDKVQRCPFKGTASVTSCCTPKGTIFSESVRDENRLSIGHSFIESTGSMLQFWSIVFQEPQLLACL